MLVYQDITPWGYQDIFSTVAHFIKMIRTADRCETNLSVGTAYYKQTTRLLSPTIIVVINCHCYHQLSNYYS